MATEFEAGGDQLGQAAKRFTLYGVKGWGSTLVESMLAVAGIDYDFIDLPEFEKPGPNHDRLAAINPLVQVPTLVLPDGMVMTESAAIALHISEIAPGAGLAPPPGDPDRPHFLRWLVWMVANIYPTFTYGDFPERWTSDTKRLFDATEDYRKRLWRQLDGEAGAPFFLGSRFSAIDVYLAAMIHWRPRRLWFEAEAPRLLANAEEAMKRPEVGEVMKRNFG